MGEVNTPKDIHWHARQYSYRKVKSSLISTRTLYLSLSPLTGVSPTVTRMEACASSSPAAAMGTWVASQSVPLPKRMDRVSIVALESMKLARRVRISVGVTELACAQETWAIVHYIAHKKCSERNQCWCHRVCLCSRNLSHCALHCTHKVFCIKHLSWVGALAEAEEGSGH